MLEKRVSHNGIDLSPVSRATLGYYRNYDRWDDNKGTPLYYNIDPEEARKKLLLFPIPGGDDAGANLILTYFPKPTDLALDADIPFNSYLLLVQFHIALPCYAAWLLLGYNQQDEKTIIKRNQLLNQYSSKITDAIDKFGNTASEPIRMKGGRYWK